MTDDESQCEPQLLDRLLAQLEDSDPEVRFSAIDAIGALGESLIDDSSEYRIRHTLFEMLDDKQYYSAAAKALYLRKCSSDVAVRSLLKGLNAIYAPSLDPICWDLDSLVTHDFLDPFRWYEQSASETLEFALGNPSKSESERVLAAHVLAHLGNLTADTESILSDAMNDLSAAVRRASVAAFQRITGATPEIFVDRLRIADDDNAITSARALCALDDPGRCYVRELVEALATRRGHAYCSIAYALFHLPARDQHVVCAALDDPRPRVRVAVVWLLHENDQHYPKCCEIAARELASDDSDVRCMASGALLPERRKRKRFETPPGALLAMVPLMLRFLREGDEIESATIRNCSETLCYLDESTRAAAAPLLVEGIGAGRIPEYVAACFGLELLPLLFQAMRRPAECDDRFNAKEFEWKCYHLDEAVTSILMHESFSGAARAALTELYRTEQSAGSDSEVLARISSQIGRFQSSPQN